MSDDTLTLISKPCCVCKVVKPLNEYGSNKRSRDGYQYRCRACNTAQIYARRDKDPASYLASQKRYCDRNRSKRREGFKRWYGENRHKVLSKAGSTDRQNRLSMAIPKWADIPAIRATYELAKVRSILSGCPYEVDHIVPLIHKLVCGLHTHTNLQVVEMEVNRAKGNRKWPDMPETVDV